jgi:hypothetical protein
MRPPQPASRGLSTPLSHVLSIGITTILIVGLMTGASGFLEDQSQQTARMELDTIGTRLAGELDRADTLGSQGDDVTLTSRHPDRVAGSTYTVQLLDDTAVCDAVPTETCLYLSVTEYEYESVVPIDNETRLHLQEASTGIFEIQSTGGRSSPQAPTRSLDLSGRVGIGGDVGAGPPIGVGTSLEQKPIARFTFRPGQPQTGSPITFDATGSRDPDGTVETYEWDWDNDDTYEDSTSKPTTTIDHTFPSGEAGWQNVTLRVTDDSGSTGTYSRELRVSGLQYNQDLEALPGSPDGVNFTVTNKHGQQIEIERVLIDPDQSSIYEVEEGESFHELEIDGGTDGYVEWYDELDVPEDGAIVDLDADGNENGGNIFLNDGQTATVTIRYFNDDIDNEELTIGIRYRIGDDYSSNVFTDTVDP